jgi:hypothetical protein
MKEVGFLFDLMMDADADRIRLDALGLPELRLMRIPHQ